MPLDSGGTVFPGWLTAIGLFWKATQPRPTL